ncbi:MAG: flagellar FlbD family protein [Spirochaetes bacterium]|nr:flagellar FlbD family protein [Spirochaetota bacterium]
MIKVTRLDDSEFYLNPHQIEFIESRPDTIISLVSGRKMLVKEKPEEVLRKNIEYRKKLGYIKAQED